MAVHIKILILISISLHEIAALQKWDNRWGPHEGTLEEAAQKAILIFYKKYLKF